MRLLINSFMPGILITAAFSCAPGGPMTPRDALFSLRVAFEKKDPDHLKKVLSSESLAEIERVCSLFNAMNGRQLEAAAARYRVSPQALKDLAARDYLKLILANQKGKGAIARAVAARPLSIRKGDKEAVFVLENGLEITFVKEGPYWKFDMTPF